MTLSRKRAISVNDLLNRKFKGLEFEGEWLESFGQPEITGTWLIWGNSGNGKTRFALQLAKYLSGFCKVVYNSLEEGMSMSLQRAVEQVDFRKCKNNVMILDKEHIDDLIKRLAKPRSAEVVIIDSLQYTGMTYREYKTIKDRFRNKLFVFVSHAEGKMPEGRVARSVRFDANVKIWIEDYKAYPVSRYGGGKPYVIWDNEYESLIYNG
jgi:hypothetical protein